MASLPVASSAWARKASTLSAAGASPLQEVAPLGEERRRAGWGGGRRREGGARVSSARCPAWFAADALALTGLSWASASSLITE